MKGLTTIEVHTRAGVSYRQLDYWVRTGVVLPSIKPATGSGSNRVWSERDLDVVTVVARFARLGGHREVLCWAASIADELLGNGITDAWLVVDATTGEGGVALPGGLIELLGRYPDGCWVVPLGQPDAR